MRRAFIVVALLPLMAALAPGQDAKRLQDLSIILGRPTEKSVAVSVLSPEPREGYIEYGTASGVYTGKTELTPLPAGTPVEVLIDKLDRDQRYFYRLLTRPPGTQDFRPEPEGVFHTQRSPGSTFTFDVQGDSHPEREGKMYDPELYTQTMRHAATDPPDFYLTMGDDFSIERLINRKTLSQAAVDQVYAYQHRFLSLVGRTSALFLVNGNHDQAARCNLDGTAASAAVLAGRARTRFFPLPAPDAFYGGDAEEVEHIGLVRDYYSWTWGDSLFVVIDPYWHSTVPVDNVAGAERRDSGKKKDGGKKRDLWGVTLGDAQYRWLTRTLTESKARWKFVFCHHVLGTGRGGIECAGLYEWGGKNKKGEEEFEQKRPGWALPIHPLMVKTGVTIFFQGHDHLFARQELDGVVYQSCPNPADPTYQAFNCDAYRSGDILPNSGHLRITVSPAKVRLDYVRSYLPKDATAEHPDGEVALAYEIPALKPATVRVPAASQAAPSVLAPGAKVLELGKGFQFTEGPAADDEGNVCFSDVRASRTYRWSPEEGVSIFRENTHSANGLAFDAAGNLFVCESASGRIVEIDPKGNVTVVANKYQGKRFNQPNDLWIDPKGGIYFSDPIYGRAEKTQDGEHVYYVTPDRRRVVRVIDDMVRPNGLVGTPDGKTLYVADHGAGKTYRYAVNADGTLRDKTLFAPNGSDGMKLDSQGNVYLTTDAVLVYNPSGKLIARIEVPQQPTNLCFAGKGGRMLFITARSSIYAVQMNVSGAKPLSQQVPATRPPTEK